MHVVQEDEELVSNPQTFYVKPYIHGMPRICHILYKLSAQTTL
jgi:hypothetical protein